MPVTGNNSFQPYDILSIRLSTDGFYFSITNSANTHAVRQLQNEQVDEGLSLTANFKRLCADERLPKLDNGRVEVTIVSTKYIVIPLELFDDEQAESVYYYTHLRHDNEAILYQILPASGVAVIFAVEKSLLACVREYYAEPEFTVHIAPVIEQLSSKNRRSDGRRMYAYLHKFFVDVYVYQHGHLDFVNAFSCSTVEDYMYFLLNVWQHQGMDQQVDELYIAGEMPHQTRLIHELKQFVKHIIIS